VNTGDHVTEYGSLIASLQGSSIFENELTIEDTNGNWLFNISDNAYNFEINPCRSENKLASTFYTIDANQDFSDVIDRDLFVAMVSTLILNLESDSGDHDACTGWTIYGRWLLLSLALLILVCGVPYFAWRKGLFKSGLSFFRREKFAFLDKEDYPVTEKKESSREVSFTREDL